MDILHLTPWYATGPRGAGHWKAVQAIQLSLRDLGREVTSRVLEADDGRDLPTDLDDSVRDVIVEYTRAPEVIAAIRRRCAGARVHVRAHNAEAWHHLHRGGGARAALASPRLLYGVCRLLERDSRCRRRSHTVLGISDWDNRHYWSRLPGRARIIDVPYFSPWPDLRPGVTPLPWAQRDSAILCLPGARDAIGRAGAAGFYALARMLSSHLEGWRFGITAGVIKSPRDEPPPAGVEVITDLIEPWDLLCRVKAVAVLTPLGFGAKTTIFDALAAGCHVLVHPKLAGRLPSVARGRCLVVDPTSAGDAGAIAAGLKAEPMVNDVNSRLRTQAGSGLRAAMGGTE